MDKREAKRLITKYEIQEKNGIQSDDTLTELLSGISDSCNNTSKIMDENDQFIQRELGKVSPFFFRAAEQYQALIMDKYNCAKKLFDKLLCNYNGTDFQAFYNIVCDLNSGCDSFTELLVKEAKKNDQDQKVEIDRIESVINNLDFDYDDTDIQSIMEFIHQSFAVLDILFCNDTFCEIQDVNRRDHYQAYADYLFMEYPLLYQPVECIKQLQKKEES